MTEIMTDMFANMDGVAAYDSMDSMMGHYEEWNNEGDMTTVIKPNHVCDYAELQQTMWYDEQGQLHRDDDLPAIDHSGGMQNWYQHGKLHRDGGPAIMYAGGMQRWYQHGVLHRDGGPAVMDNIGFTDISKRRIQKWYQHGLLHRDDDLPAWINDEEQRWYQHGKLHRDGDLPDIMTSYSWNGITLQWHQDDKLHRDNGLPAVVRKKTNNQSRHLYQYEWYSHGNYIKSNNHMETDELNQMSHWEDKRNAHPWD